MNAIGVNDALGLPRAGGIIMETAPSGDGAAHRARYCFIEGPPVSCATFARLRDYLEGSGDGLLPDEAHQTWRLKKDIPT